jgi:hypothetical protein
MEKVIEKCQGCARVVDDHCGACPVPAAKWRNGACNMATHIKAAPAAEKGKVNPLKASKRAVNKK